MKKGIQAFVQESEKNVPDYFLVFHTGPLDSDSIFESLDTESRKARITTRLHFIPINYSLTLALVQLNELDAKKKEEAKGSISRLFTESQSKFLTEAKKEGLCIASEIDTKQVKDLEQALRAAWKSYAKSEASFNQHCKEVSLIDGAFSRYPGCFSEYEKIIMEFFYSMGRRKKKRFEKFLDSVFVRSYCRIAPRKLVSRFLVDIRNVLLDTGTEYMLPTSDKLTDVFQKRVEEIEKRVKELSNTRTSLASGAMSLELSCNGWTTTIEARLKDVRQKFQAFLGGGSQQLQAKRIRHIEQILEIGKQATLFFEQIAPELDALDDRITELDGDKTQFFQDSQQALLRIGLQMEEMEPDERKSLTASLSHDFDAIKDAFFAHTLEQATVRLREVEYSLSDKAGKAEEQRGMIRDTLRSAYRYNSLISFIEAIQEQDEPPSDSFLDKHMVEDLKSTVTWRAIDTEALRRDLGRYGDADSITSHLISQLDNALTTLECLTKELGSKLQSRMSQNRQRILWLSERGKDVKRVGRTTLSEVNKLKARMTRAVGAVDESKLCADTYTDSNSIFASVRSIFSSIFEESFDVIWFLSCQGPGKEIDEAALKERFGNGYLQALKGLVDDGWIRKRYVT